MFTISNSELNKLPEQVFEGMLLEHKNTDGEWETVTLQYGKDGKTGEKSSVIGFYTTKDGKAYLASINNKLIESDSMRVKLTVPSTN